MSAKTETKNNNNEDNNNKEDKKVEQQKKKQEEPKTYDDEVELATEERLKYLAKKNVYLLKYIDDKGNEEIREYQRKPLKTKHIKQITNLRNHAAGFGLFGTNKPVISNKTYTDPNTMIFDAFFVTAKYSLGIESEEEYDNLVWEDDQELNKQDIWGLKSVLEASIKRGVRGGAFFTLPSKDV